MDCQQIRYIILDIALNLPKLPDGLYWDTSDLLKPTGILRVTNVLLQALTMSIWTIITMISYYTLEGDRIDTPTKKGIYIKNGKKVIIK